MKNNLYRFVQYASIGKFHPLYPVPGTVSYGQVTSPAHSAPADRCWDSQTTHPGLCSRNRIVKQVTTRQQRGTKICPSFWGHQKPPRLACNCLAEAFTPASLVCHPITCHLFPTAPQVMAKSLESDNLHWVYMNLSLSLSQACVCVYICILWYIYI